MSKLLREWIDRALKAEKQIAELMESTSPPQESEELAEARRMTDWERELRLKIVSFVNTYYLADVPDYEEDGFGGGASQPCHECGLRLMQVVRPGKVQCGLCG